MLHHFRSFMKSTIFRFALFGLLIASFGLWGTSDLLTNRVSGRNIIEVGNVSVSGVEFQREYNQRRQQLTESGFDSNVIQQYGLPDITLNSMLDNALFQAESNALSLRASQEEIREAVRSTEFFQAPNGEFSSVVMKRVLGYNNLTVKEYYQLVADNHKIIALQGAVWQNHKMAGLIRDFSYNYSQESRGINYIEINAEQLTLQKTADETELQSYYTENQENFRKAEQRNISYVYVSLSDLQADIQPTNEMIETYYQENIALYQEKETRGYQFIRFPDEAKASAFSVKISQAQDFERLAKAEELNIIQNEPIIKQNIADNALADAVFSLEQQKWSAPVKGSLGYYVILLGDVKAETIMPLADVRAEVIKKLQEEVAVDAYIQKLSLAEDLSISGSELEEIAGSLETNIKQTGLIGRFGTAINGENIRETLPPNAQFLTESFEQTRGVTSYVYTIEQSGFFLLRVQDIVSSYIPDFNIAQDDARTAWQSEQKQQLAQETIDALKERLAAGETLQGLSSNGAYNLSNEGDLKRDNQKFNDDITQKIFVTAKNQTIDAVANNQYYLITVTDIQIPSNIANDDEKFTQFSTTFENRYTNIVVDSYKQALSDKHKPQINNALLQQIVNQIEGADY